MKSLKLPPLILLALGVFPGSFSARAAAAPSTTVPHDHFHGPYEKRWEPYFASMHGKPVDLIFIGDSITEGWLGKGKPVWDRDYASHALDFGQGGDKTQDVLWRLENLDLKEFKPKVAVILIGTNNTADTPEDIAAGVQAVIETTRKTFGEIKVVLLSILPNRRANDKMMAADQLIQKLADGKNVVYLDLVPKFPPVGDNWKGLLPDHLHLTTEGYETWAAELNPVLAKLLPAGH